MKEGAGTRSLGVWACPPDRVARNCSSAADTGGAAGGVWAMDCANETRERRARRMRTGFFMFISQIDGTGGKPAASKGKGALARLGRVTSPGSGLDGHGAHFRVVVHALHGRDIEDHPHLGICHPATTRLRPSTSSRAPT